MTIGGVHVGGAIVLTGLWHADFFRAELARHELWRGVPIRQRSPVGNSFSTRESSVGGTTAKSQAGTLTTITTG